MRYDLWLAAAVLVVAVPGMAASADTAPPVSAQPQPAATDRVTALTALLANREEALVADFLIGTDQQKTAAVLAAAAKPDNDSTRQAQATLWHKLAQEKILAHLASPDADLAAYLKDKNVTDIQLWGAYTCSQQTRPPANKPQGAPADRAAALASLLGNDVEAQVMDWKLPASANDLVIACSLRPAADANRQSLAATLHDTAITQLGAQLGAIPNPELAARLAKSSPADLWSLYTCAAAALPADPKRPAIAAPKDMPAADTYSDLKTLLDPSSSDKASTEVAVGDYLLKSDEPKKAAARACARLPASDRSRISVAASLHESVGRKMRQHLTTSPDSGLAAALQARGISNEALKAYYCGHLTAGRGSAPMTIDSPALREAVASAAAQRRSDGTPEGDSHAALSAFERTPEAERLCAGTPPAPGPSTPSTATGPASQPPPAVNRSSQTATNVPSPPAPSGSTASTLKIADAIGAGCLGAGLMMIAALGMGAGPVGLLMFGLLGAAAGVLWKM